MRLVLIFISTYFVHSYGFCIFSLRRVSSSVVYFISVLIYIWDNLFSNPFSTIIKHVEEAELISLKLIFFCLLLKFHFPTLMLY